MADLTVLLTEQLTLNGYPQGSTSSKSITGINESSKRIVTLSDTTERTLISFGSAIGAGTFVTSAVKYIRITNLGKNEEVINLSLEATNDEAIIDLEAGHFFILSKASGVLEAATTNIDVGDTGSQDLVAIKAKSESSSVNLEI